MRLAKPWAQLRPQVTTRLSDKAGNYAVDETTEFPTEKVVMLSCVEASCMMIAGVDGAVLLSSKDIVALREASISGLNTHVASIPTEGRYPSYLISMRDRATLDPRNIAVRRMLR